MDLFLLFDYIGTLVFAISGTLSAAQKRFDLFGAVFIGFVTAIGGGTVRDIMLGDTPVAWIRSMDYFYIIIAGILITVLFQRSVIKLRRTMFLFDTIGIGVFMMIGLEKALNMGISEPIAVIMGLSSAVVGGVIRDTLNNEVPLIFHKEIYATACILGALVYLVLKHFEVPLYINQTVTSVIIIIIRLFAIKYNISLPKITLNESK